MHWASPHKTITGRNNFSMSKQSSQSAWQPTGTLDADAPPPYTEHEQPCATTAGNPLYVDPPKPYLDKASLHIADHLEDAIAKFNESIQVEPQGSKIEAVFLPKAAFGDGWVLPRATLVDTLKPGAQASAMGHQRRLFHVRTFLDENDTDLGPHGEVQGQGNGSCSSSATEFDGWGRWDAARNKSSSNELWFTSRELATALVEYLRHGSMGSRYLDVDPRTRGLDVEDVTLRRQTPMGLYESKAGFAIVIEGRRL
ncbi:uncharacterized protein J7T54_005200 [Emericellopsis cladophorae]|uniref:Uncharacterized protein n=1 Tax=Emericellopsis cladophorae TaxID=2686198 RepID=A0A9P9XXC2_9HYPO|nr:uncharacterized protein J7T54_005200 [Emericellopsis cladophorae]KAI6779386.1 hypothetical protein J7T54_005200 [Emericellopsis cladophorae]